jgi:outer membrane protein assembly factor BamD (BamD/ComL family)
MRWLICGLMILLAAPSYPEQWEVQCEEEALFLRRIVDFWREGEYQIAKTEIEEFLLEYPDSSFSQTLYASLGDLYIRENNFKGALMQYARVEHPEITSRIFLNRMQCLLELQWHATLADECEAYLIQEPLDQQQKLRATYLLAIALYQQCLNAPDDSETLQRLANRALPYFQDLLQGELSSEIAQASAHLCNILKDYSGAAGIYLHLAETPGADREEMLFQAALFQAQYDKTLALQTFQEIAESEMPRAGDAVYNSLILAYECGEYEKLIQTKASLLEQIPTDQHNSAHLFFGRSYLQLKQYPEALTELLSYAETAEPSEIFRSALVDILNASYQLDDEATLSSALTRFAELYPEDPQLPKGYLSQAILLKKRSQLDQTRLVLETIRTKFPQSDEFQSALFEQLHLEYQERQWEECRKLCRDYLGRYPASDLAPFAWRFLAASSSQLSTENPTPIQREQLAFDLESLLMQPDILATKERSDWTFLLAKTNFDLNCYEEAIVTL